MLAPHLLHLAESGKCMSMLIRFLMPSCVPCSLPVSRLILVRLSCTTFLILSLCSQRSHLGNGLFASLVHMIMCRSSPPSQCHRLCSPSQRALCWAKQ